MTLEQRAAVRERLSGRPYDVLVVGGGITGAGIALDAASRGLRVALVEKEDVGWGTSSRSSSLVHGGLRYLEQGMFGLMRESAVERDRLRRLAPHLVRPLPFVLPVPSRRRSRLVGTGLWIYDALSSFRTVARHRRLDTDEIRGLAPGLRVAAGTRGFEWHDCRTDDARLVLQVVRTAQRHGADVLTRAEVVEFRTAGGRVIGATVRDRLAGEDFGVQARFTVAATGVWADATRALAGSGRPMLLPSKGIHLVLPAERVRVRAAALVPSAQRDGRMVFVLPWEGQVVVGTTDEAYEGPLDAPAVTADDAAYCLDAVNAAFGTDLTVADAVGGWAGLRPLLRDEAEGAGGGSGAPTPAPMDMGSDRLSRRHEILRGPEGLLTITGGKLTTYRHMAEQVVDEIVRGLGAGGTRGPSPTRRIALGLRGELDAAIARTRDVALARGLDPDPVASLVERHGDEAARLVALAADHDEWRPLVPGLPYLAVEARWAVDEELAGSVADVLQRRMRVSLRDVGAGAAVAGQVAGLLAEAWGWSEADAARSVTDHLDAVRRERGPLPGPQPAAPPP